MWGNDVPARAAASPGLLRRRYSVPETIMRKYRLAQQRSEGESDETGRWSASGATAGTRNSCAWCGAKSGARREREHMRKSALLRLWGRAGASPARTCPCVPCPPCGTRSLDASHSELHTSPRRLRLDSRDRHSDCSSSGSPARVASSCTDPTPDIARETSPRRITETRIVRTPIDSPILQVETTDRSLTSSSDIFTTSMPTMKENPFKTSEPYTQIFKSEYIDGRVSERSISAENDESNIVPYTKPKTLETPSYDMLEIIVSETIDVLPTKNPSFKNKSPEKILPPTNTTTQPMKHHLTTKKKSNMDLDEYVSNILVESLNSLTDQLESMNASIGSDRKLNIVEKEIKVKLQNTGVNTIVHLSPTSNNQIIFGNEELYESDGRRDNCNNPHDAVSVNIAEDVLSVETNNNFTSAESLRNNDAELSHDKIKTDNFLNISNETVNKAVLQQIQKLFKEELQNIEPDMNSPDGPLPGISHIEISNVDVFIDNNGGSYPNTDTIEMQTKRNSGIEVLGGVGAGNYYQEVEDNAIVPRFSAFPHTESMEVNTSSSEDAELLGSECASLVDSLDDPNSPRSILLRRSYNTNKRSELARSAIDVLDLLPEDATQGPNSPKEKGESFFIRIKDNDCDCEKENIVVADHMPETIKQRLYRRHRKREMRMECARRSKVKQLKRDLESQNRKEIYKTKREIEKECMVIINSVIDDVIAKIAQDEYKCMRISQKSNKLVATKSDDNLMKKQWKKDNENNNNKNARKLTKNNISHSCSENLDKNHRKSDRIIRGKLSLQTHPPLSPDDCEPKRIYQKSEIHDGNKCIEILEILEYVNSSQNSDTTTSDENHNLSSRNRKSRIPVPVNEKVQKTSKISTQRNHKSNGSRRTPPILSRDRNGKSHLLANVLFDVLSEETSAHEIPVRRASVPCESRARSNSLRFKNVFDIIPEERSSLSLESTGDDSYNRRASAPSLSEFPSTEEEIRPVESNKYRDLRYSDTKNAGTSPMPDIYRAQVVHVGAMTSPIRKSAGTSPIRITSGESRVHSEQMNKHAQPKLAKRVQKHDEGIPRTLAPPLHSHRTASTIY